MLSVRVASMRSQVRESGTSSRLWMNSALLARALNMGVGSFWDVANNLGLRDALDHVPIGLVAKRLEVLGHRGDYGLVDFLGLFGVQVQALD